MEDSLACIFITFSFWTQRWVSIPTRDIKEDISLTENLPQWDIDWDTLLKALKFTDYWIQFNNGSSSKATDDSIKIFGVQIRRPLNFAKVSLDFFFSWETWVNYDQMSSNKLLEKGQIFHRL
jgi:hypothetical protein